MKRLVVLLVLALSVPVSAETVWTLRTGPTAVDAIPLNPVQLVDAWRGQYSDGVDLVTVYATQSRQFFAPRSPEVTAVPPTPWTVVVVFPPAWTAATRSEWLASWLADFRTLSTLPDPGFPIVFPAVLRKS